MRISGRNAGSNTIQSMNGGLVLFQDAATSLPDAGFYEKSEFFSRDNEGKEIKGLAGEFFTNMAFQGQPVLKQVAEIINLEWETDSPFPGVPAIQMSARWSGFIKVEQAGPYKFAVSGDDGYRLLIDEKVVLENWSEHAEEVSVTVVNLEKDREYPVQLQFYQNSGGAAIRLGYQPVSETDTDKSMQGHFAFFTDNTDVVVDHCWFRGGWFDSRTILWQDIVNFNMPSRQPRDNAPGGSMYVPFKLKPGETESIKLLFCWYVPSTRLKYGETPPETEETAKCCSTSTQCCMPSGEFFEPWYAGKFKDIRDVARYWQKNYADLKQKTLLFTDTFYDTNLPPEVVEAVAANLTILKSPTVLRQKDGRLWAWEGCHDLGGCCAGSCTHVWNYAQAISRLFPELERSLRNTEFKNSQNDKGHQTFRASLPIRSAAHNFHAAADGQLGGIMKMYREWRISGDTEWLKSLWPKVKQSFDYCSQTWDPNGKGVLEEPHHNTYDIEFWGPDGMCSSFYLGATQAMIKMGRALNEDVSHYEKLLAKGKKFMERELWDGEYFYQKVVWEGLQTPNPLQEITQAWNISYSNEALELFRAEGPKYQYGKGCISDGVLGCWIAEMCGLPRFLDGDKVKGHLVSVHKYNLRRDLLDHVNPQRPSFACGDDGGLLLCTWPKGGQLSLPFVYSNEVWTGIEYQAASHLMCMGEVEKGLEIVRTARDRYDGRKRNPFNEYECGHWYARAMASYGLIQGMTGVFYDAVDQILYVDSRMGEDFKSFLSTETGWGSAGLNGGKPFLNVQYGVIGVKKVVVSGEEVEMD
ncbi:hypothetical protein JW935_26645 [candidate division KSB1 bacterium]|nr:hypothetical protein [candidate division KSB1 bacterium]